MTAASPLLAHPELATDRRQPRLQGSRSDARVLVVAHVYYPEVWFDIEDRLVRIPEPYDLVVSLVEGRTEVLEPQIAERLPHAMIHRVPNLGRDLGSLVELAGAGVFDGYDAILKVHTKRSPHRVDGDAWRVALLDGLMPSPEGIRRIVELLRSDRSRRARRSDREACTAPETWGSNQVLVEALAARIPFAFDPDVLRYPAGSMYLGAAVGPPPARGSSSSAESISSPRRATSTARPRTRSSASSAWRPRRRGSMSSTADDVASRLHRARRRPTRRPKVLAFYLPQFHQIPGERRLVGNGVHRLGERRPRPARSTRGTRSRSSRASSAATTCRIPR